MTITNENLVASSVSHAYRLCDVPAEGVAFLDGDVVKTKRCSKCKLVMDVSCFSKNRCAKDGLSYQCKACVMEYYNENRTRLLVRFKEYNRLNRDRILNRKREYYAKNAERIKDIIAQYNIENPSRRLSRDAVNNALSRGEITCGVCAVHGSACDGGKTEAHHDSYEQDKRLDVKWMCRSAHRQLHVDAARLLDDGDKEK